MLIIRSCYFIRKGVKLYMAWTTNYSGLQLDETLEKGRDLKIVNNGWIKLEASESSPTNLGNLRNPGNYSTSYWIDGPTLEENISLLNISVILINDVIHQFINVLGYTYSRIVSDDDVSEWSIDQTYGILKPSVSAPTNVVDGKTVWLDTTIATSPILKIYYNGEWKEVISASAMQSTVYDPQGKKIDIFEYINSSLSKILNNSSSINFEDHINSVDIHVTAAEKDKWDTAPTVDSLDDHVAEIKSDIDKNITEGYKSDISKFKELDTAITEADTIFEHHITNTTIHPDASKRNKWNSKSDNTHTHHQDGKVIVDPAHVSGVIPLNKLPYDVDEKVFDVKSISEMYTYSKNQVHVGDTFCIETADGNIWYVVVDDQKLGSEEGYKLISKPTNADWSKITNRPTTVSGYEITDAVSTSDVSDIQDRVDDLKEEYSDDDKEKVNIIAEAEAARNEAYAIINSGNPFVLLDLVVDKLESIAK